jgi:hypothetical protein
LSVLSTPSSTTELPGLAESARTADTDTDTDTAYLDRLTWVARSHLVQLIGHLHPDRHTHVTEVIRTLIGNL